LRARKDNLDLILEVRRVLLMVLEHDTWERMIADHGLKPLVRRQWGERRKAGHHDDLQEVQW
jgi:hypothetical protein